MTSILNQMTLSRWPVPAKIVVTLFLVMIGTGYLAALANLYQRHELADGQPGMTPDDLRANFHGMTVESEQIDEPAPPMSRMLEQVIPGGDMRKHLTAGDISDVRTLIGWLELGAEMESFQQASLVEEGDPTPEDVIAGRCLRCHNTEDGEKADTPYGPDIFTVDYKMVYKYAEPGTAIETTADASANPGVKQIGPQTLSHLLLVTHIHMLSIPVFTLVLAGFFALGSLPTRWKSIIGPLPMVMIALDFAGWWLARIDESFLVLMLVAAPLFGLTLAVQLFTVLASLWSPKSTRTVIRS